MQRILPLTVVLAVLAMLTGLPLAEGTDYPQPTSETVYSVAGFLVPGGSSSNAGATLVPVTIDRGTLKGTPEPDTNGTGFSISPIFEGSAGTFTYNGEDIFLPYTPFYDVPSSPAFGGNWTFTLYWEKFNFVIPIIFGFASGGSMANFSLPTNLAAVGATYCGFANFWAHAPGSPGMGSRSTPNVLITTTWEPSLSGDDGVVKTVKLAGVGVNDTMGTAGTYPITTSAASYVRIATYGSPNSTALNGGTIGLQMHFYGPGAIQASASFSGTWEGYQVAGGLVANLVPGNPGKCSNVNME